MNDLTSSTIIVGQFGRPHGIRGWINVNSYTSDPTALFQFESLSSNSNFFDIFSFQEYTEHGSGFIARVKDVDSREKAEEWKNKYIYVSDKEMPSLGLEEYYWYQLLGLTVQTKLNKDNQILGKVVSIIETGSNDVLVVQGDDNSIDLRERSIPCSKEFLVDVNLDDAIITVTWDPSF